MVSVAATTAPKTVGAPMQPSRNHRTFQPAVPSSDEADPINRIARPRSLTHHGGRSAFKNCERQAVRNRSVPSALGTGTSPRGGRAGRLIVALVALTLAGGASFGAAPAYAATMAQRQATAGGYTVSPATGGFTRAVLAADATTAAFQDRLDDALQHMLDTVLGPGRSTVTTNVELDLDQVATSSTTYQQDPSAGALSERISERSYIGDNGGTRYDSSSASRVNALDELHETRREAPGDIIRLSVAVLVDEAAAANLDLAQVRELIAVAAGIDASRGDRVTVTAMPMPMRTATATPTDNAVAQPGTESPAALRTALIAAVLILLTCAALLAVRKQRRQASAAAGRRELLRAQLHFQRTPIPAAAIATALDEDRGQQRAVESVDPAQTAQQLREWIDPGR
jgi:flagellar M-ring protein FliF